MKAPELEELRAAYARDLHCEQPSERWLIQDVWARAAVGVVGGAAKSYKSFLALDLAVSVASGTPALDRFPVDDPGLALVYLAEDSLPQIRARLEALCRHRGLDFQRLNLAVITVGNLAACATTFSLRLSLKGGWARSFQASKKLFRAFPRWSLSTEPRMPSTSYSAESTAA